MDDQALRSPQFSLRLLFAATTTCAMAFALIGRQQAPDLLRLLATCVPLFWAGVAAVIAGEILRSRRVRLLNVPGEIVAIMGVILWLAAMALALTVFVLAYAEYQ